MTADPRPPLPIRAAAYVFCIVGLGALAVGQSVLSLSRGPANWLEWGLLALLTLASGVLTVKLPAVRATISISETFVFSGALLFGPAFGTIIVLLDAFVMMMARTKRLRWEQIVFNLAASPLSIWIAAHVAGIQPLPTDVHVQLGPYFFPILAFFTVSYYLLNGWFVAFAVAAHYGGSPFAVWKKNFSGLFGNYVAGASIAALLALSTRKINLTFICVIVPLLIAIYRTYSKTAKLIEAEREKTEAEREKSAELKAVFMRTVEALSMALEGRDEVTGGHIHRVKRNARALADRLGITDEKQLDALEIAAVLHDTGKVAVPDAILHKPGPLTPAEFDRMKVHAPFGADIMKAINFPYPVEPIVRHHHECWDGSGYPDGLRGEEIPFGARILSVVDCYDALTSDRQYRPRRTRQDAVQMLMDRRGTSYDPGVVDEFVKIVDRLEEQEAAAQIQLGSSPDETRLKPEQLAMISATTAEEREFNELHRELSRAPTVAAAADVLFRHLRRVVPATTLALYLPKHETNELKVVACLGAGASTIEGMCVHVGQRISGWAFAEKQVVLNSDATLELGPVARTFSTPLRYTLAVPLVSSGQAIAVVVLFGTDLFKTDHQRMAETAITLFQPSLSANPSSDAKQPPHDDGTTQAKSKVH